MARRLHMAIMGTQRAEAPRRSRPSAAGKRGAPRRRTPRSSILSLSADSHLRVLLRRAAGTAAIRFHARAESARRALEEAAPSLVVVDDLVLAPPDRGWFLEQVRRLAPEARVVYVASDHDEEVERSVRAHGVLHYTSRPIDEDRFERVLAALIGPPARLVAAPGAS
jgi:DNA-binding NtrC family response regulator